MFIPYRVDVPFNHKPVMNWLLIASIIIAFMVKSWDLNACQRYFLNGWNITGMVGHIWLHAGFLHLFGNMLFLWLFGNAVCSKVGNIFYIPVFIGLGLIASASHLLFAFDGRPVVGASGAINGIVGMYLVFFPENRVSVMFWFIFLFFIFPPYFFVISGFWVILLWFVFDIIGVAWGNANIAYISHIGGFLGGVGLASLLLKFKLVLMERDEKSIFELILGKKKKVSKVSKEEIEYWQRVFNKQKSEKPKTYLSSLKPKKTEIERLRFNCSCGQRIKVPIIYAGKHSRCPKCKTQLIIPHM